MDKFPKICFIVPWFGAWPRWMEYYLMSCITNPAIDWHFFSDNHAIPRRARNLFLHHLTLEDLNSYISNKLGLKTRIIHPYKLCDFKPAYGYIFQDVIKDCDFWGYTDIDLVYGNILYFLPPSVFAGYDVISPHSDFIPGHFCLVRNSPEMNCLYQASSCFREIFESELCFCFDEKLLKKGIPPNSTAIQDHIRKKASRHLLVSKFTHNTLYRPIIKVLPKVVLQKLSPPNRKTQIRDFNEIVDFFAESGSLRVYRKTLYGDDIMKKMGREKSWEIIWRSGKLFDCNREILYFHFQLAKNDGTFCIEGKSPGVQKQFFLKNYS